MKLFIKTYLPFLVFAIAFIILRLPSLFEPHWYGDEGIYASIAFAIEHGKKMYIDVFDNRLPAIYYLYTLGDTQNRLLLMRIMNIIAGLITLFGLYKIGMKIGLKAFTWIAIGLATWFLGTPVWEGNIANNENFFLPLTVWGVFCALHRKNSFTFISGMLFGAAFIVKFPSFFSCIAIVFFLFLTTDKKIRKKLTTVLWFGGGFLMMIVMVAVLLLFNGDLWQAVQYGLLNNSSYITSFVDYGPPPLLKVVVLITLLSTLAILYLKKHISDYFLLLFSLLFLDYYSVLFSSRDYEHYLLQIIPAFALSTAYLFSLLSNKKNVVLKIVGLICFYNVLLFGQKLFYQGFGLPVEMEKKAYYAEFWAYMQNKKVEKHKLPFIFGKEDAHLVKVKEAVSDYHTDKIYVYTDRSWVYDYAHILPSAFFVAHYHQYLVKDGPERLIKDLSFSQPRLIMVDTQEEQSESFRTFLDENYSEVNKNDYFIYFMRKK